VPFIGNDIVSLNCPENQISFSNNAYLQKAFTTNELLEINSCKINYLPQIYWTCKESAYKILVKKGLTKQFSPALYSVDLEYISENNLSVINSKIQYKDQIVFAQTAIQPNYIHTIAADEQSALSAIKSNVIKYVGSAEMYDALIVDFAQYFGIDATFLQIEKDKNQAPFLINGKLKTRHEISFSHDGEFAAFVFL